MVRKIEWNGLDAIEFAAGGYEAMLIPSIGSNLVKLLHTATGADILRTPAVEDMDVFCSRPQIFGLPLLFPPNRIEDGTYNHDGIKYQYPITIPEQNNYHHGNIKSLPFEISKCEDSEAEVFIETILYSNGVNDEIYRYFPHQFECRMAFRLSERGLEHTVSFSNTGGKAMPLGVGYHTPLNVPFNNSGSGEAYKLRLSVGKRWELNERTLPTGKLTELDATERLLRSEGVSPMGQAIEWAMTAENIEVDGKPYNGAVLTDTQSGISVYYEVDEQIKHWTLWNNGGQVPWICPEPQSWAINAPNVKLPDNITGFQTIVPGKTWKTVSKIYVKKS